MIEVCPGVGMHALRLAAVAAPAGQVFLYEPRSLMRRLLRENLAANSIGNVTVMTNRLGGSADESQDWRAETIDDLRLAQLLMLKINDETMAREVLSGAAETLWRLRPFLFIATGSEAALHDLALQTKDYGYRCWKMEAPLFNPNNFNLRTNDIFAASSAVALLAIPEESEQGMLTEGCTELS